MIVSKLQPGDVPAAAALDRLLFSGECWSEADLAASLEDADRLFLAAKEGERLLGFCGLQQSFEQGDILTVGVDPACRRQGIGKALLGALIEAFCTRGGKQLFLEVRASNVAAQKLYEGSGFRQISVRRGYYRQPTEDGLIYQLEV